MKRTFYGVDIAASLRSGWLVDHKTILDYIDDFATYLMAFSFIVVGAITMTDTPSEGLFTNFLKFFVAPSFFLVGLLSAWRRILQLKLMIVTTGYSARHNRLLLTQFLEKYNLPITREDKYAIYVSDPHMLSYNGLWRKDYFFIMDDDRILFNIRKHYPIISPPVYFSHILVKRDLEKFMATYHHPGELK